MYYKFNGTWSQFQLKKKKSTMLMYKYLSCRLSNPLQDWSYLKIVAVFGKYSCGLDPTQFIGDFYFLDVINIFL